MSLPAPGAARRKLPIGIQTFRKIREEGYYYVGSMPSVCGTRSKRPSTDAAFRRTISSRSIGKGDGVSASVPTTTAPLPVG